MTPADIDALVTRLRELDRDDACLQGTPMVPLHRETLREIIAALAALNAEHAKTRVRLSDALLELSAAEQQIAALKADAEEREQMLRNARMMVCAMVLSNGGQFHVTRTAMENVASDDYELVQCDEFTTGAFALTVTRAARAEKP